MYVYADLCDTVISSVLDVTNLKHILCLNVKALIRSKE